MHATMRALADWLGVVEADVLCSSQLGRAPYAAPACARAAAESCDWAGLDALLAAGPRDVLVVAHGHDLPVPPPRTLAALRALFARGIGVAIREADQFSAAIARLCVAFSQDVPGEQRVIVFATPGGHFGFGWHYDAEDVFIIQTAGDKEYFFRQNTVTERIGKSEPMDFSTYRSERSPLMSCRLLPGDLLYLPRGYWHAARAYSDALSISIGVFPSVRRAA